MSKINYSGNYIHTREYKEAKTAASNKKIKLLNAKRRIKEACNSLLKAKNEKEICKLYNNFQLVFFENTSFLRTIAQRIPNGTIEEREAGYYIRIEEAEWADTQYDKLTSYEKKVKKFIKDHEDCL